MSDFMNWIGWGPLSGTAQVLSLLAIVFAAYEYVVRSRRIAVALVSHSWAVASDESAKYYVVDIVNVGGQLAILVEMEVVNGTLVPHPEYAVNYSLDD